MSSNNLSTVYPSQVALVCFICLFVLHKLNVQYPSYIVQYLLSFCPILKVFSPLYPTGLLTLYNKHGHLLF
jgi:hypothetical protein